jgi:hypothetical protein
MRRERSDETVGVTTRDSGIEIAVHYHLADSLLDHCHLHSRQF